MSAPANTTSFSSVHVANAVLSLAFERKLRVRYHRLFDTVHEADALHRSFTGKPLFYDEHAKNLAGKLATVDQDKIAKRYIPFANGSAQAVLLEPGTTSTRAIRAAFGIHLA